MFLKVRLPRKVPLKKLILDIYGKSKEKTAYKKVGGFLFIGKVLWHDVFKEEK